MTFKKFSGRESALDFARAREEGSFGGSRKGLAMFRVDASCESYLFQRCFGRWDVSAAEVREDVYDDLVSSLKSTTKGGGGGGAKSAALSPQSSETGGGSDADASPFQVKLKSASSAAGGGHGVGTSQKEPGGKFPPVKLKAVQQGNKGGAGGTSKLSAGTDSPFGVVKLRHVEAPKRPGEGGSSGGGVGGGNAKSGDGQDDDSGVKVEGLFGARMLAEATVAGTVSTPFGTKLRQRAIHHVGSPSISPPLDFRLCSLIKICPRSFSDPPPLYFLPSFTHLTPQILKPLSQTLGPKPQTFILNPWSLNAYRCRSHLSPKQRTKEIWLAVCRRLLARGFG